MRRVRAAVADTAQTRGLSGSRSGNQPRSVLARGKRGGVIYLETVPDLDQLLAYPIPALSDLAIDLVPLMSADTNDLVKLAADPAVDAFTPLPSEADAAYIAEMLERCDRGWREGSGAFFSIRDSTSQLFLGYGAVIRLQLDACQGELGYMVAPHARGQGVATRAVSLLTDWCFKELGVIRLELRIDTRNAASAKVALANGYRLEGVLRSVHLKRERRVELGIWSRLRGDPELAIPQ
jgi:RimJ/RimL family protein N-acetyltransferase